MFYKNNQSYYNEFITLNATGLAVNADALPTATANKNGADDGAFALTVTNIDAGRYKITGTVPNGYANGDIVNISVAATITTIVTKGIVDTFYVTTSDFADIKSNTADILTDTADIQPKIGTPAVSVSADVAAVKADTGNLLTNVADVHTDVAAVKVDTASIVVSIAAGLTLSAAERLLIADAIWDELLAGHVTADSAGYMLQVAKQVIAGKMTVNAAGTLLTVYKSDNVTVLGTITISKTGTIRTQLV